MTTVAVIGGGAAGIGAAQVLLNEGFDVALFETGRRLGGNCVGVDVRGTDGRLHRIDAGVSDFNRTTFTEVTSLIDGLGLPTKPISNDVNFVSPGGESLWSCRDGQWRFSRGFAAADGVLDEIERFRGRAMEVLDDRRFWGWSAERYLDHVGASQAFRHDYFYPRAIGCFPMPDCRPQEYGIANLVRFWNMHGVVSHEPADRRTVVGGMHRYARAFEGWFVANGGRLLCGHRVIGVLRNKWNVEVRYVDADDQHHLLKADHVVLANNPHDSLPLLEHPTASERTILGQFGYQRARLVVHHDERLVGPDPNAWGAFNYVVPSGDLPRVRPTITFYPNRLGSLPEEVPDTFVTMNPHLEPHPDKVVVNRFFLHPVAQASTDAAITHVSSLQGRNRTWYAGSYLSNPFVHESALRTGIAAANGVIRFEQGKPWPDTRQPGHLTPATAFSA